MPKKASKRIQVKSCFGHLGGTLGNLLFKRMVELEWFAHKEGASTTYEITQKGYEELSKLGVDLSEFQKPAG